MPAIADEFIQIPLFYQSFKYMYYRHNYSSSDRTEVFANVYLLGKPLKEKDAITETDTAVLFSDVVDCVYVVMLVNTLEKD